MQDKHPLLSIVLHHAEGISPTAIARQAGLSVLCVRNLLTGRVASRRSTMEKVISACMLLRAQKSMKTARHDYIIHEKQRLYERTKRVARLKFTRKEIQFIAKQERGDSEVSQL